MDPRYLVQLAAIVETGSLSRAAERLNVSQPTLTRTVKIIEDRTGTPVLKRERYGVVATPLGAELAEIGRRISAESDRSKDLANVWRAGLDGQLKVGIGTVLAQLLTQDLALRALADDWSYKLTISSGVVQNMFTDLANNDLDLIISPEPMHFADQSITQIPLIETEICAVIGVKSPLYKQDFIRHEDLISQPWVSPGTSTGVLNAMVAMENVGLPIVDKLAIVASNAELTELLRTSGVITLQAYEIFQAHARETDHPGRIYRFKEPTRRRVSAWTRVGDEDRPETRHFLTQIRELVASHLPPHCLLFSAPTQISARA